ncbi:MULTISPECIES: glycosyltransferase [Streptomyces]|uniref:glycosyltransferase n=1 Tax=Streptomyces TaxID=1883 RepID=UPI001F4F90E1|nr:MULTISPECIES: glycosyltransferase [Streptomyces]
MTLRIAMLSVHTSPLHQPGTGDAGGMNVYMVELSRALAHEGARVDLFTRCLGEGHPPRVELAPGVDVLHLPAGPRRPLPNEKMPELVPDFARALLTATARGHYDVLHSHYWLAGQAGTLVAERRNIPLVHTMRTLARVKNASLAPGDRPEPGPRVHGETALAASADRLIANTTEEARALRDLYGAHAERTDVVTPGINVRIFHPADGRRAARARLGLPQDAFVPLFAGRIQPLKGPDILVHSIAALLRRSPRLRGRLLVPVIGGPSGAGTRAPGELPELCAARPAGCGALPTRHPAAGVGRLVPGRGDRNPRTGARSGRLRARPAPVRGAPRTCGGHGPRRRGSRAPKWTGGRRPGPHWAVTPVRRGSGRPGWGRSGGTPLPRRPLPPGGTKGPRYQPSILFERTKGAGSPKKDVRPDFFDWPDKAPCGDSI